MCDIVDRFLAILVQLTSNLFTSTVETPLAWHAKIKIHHTIDKNGPQRWVSLW